VSTRKRDKRTSPPSLLEKGKKGWNIPAIMIERRKSARGVRGLHLVRKRREGGGRRYRHPRFLSQKRKHSDYQTFLSLRGKKEKSGNVMNPQKRGGGKPQ